jgi:molybdate transport system substrate-binding protein
MEVGGGLRGIKTPAGSEERELEQGSVGVAGEPELATYQSALIPHRLDLVVVRAPLVAPVAGCPFAAFFVVSAGPAIAAEIKVLSSNGLRDVLHELVPQFERSTGHNVSLKVDSSTGVKRAIEGGAEFDVAVAGPDHIAALSKAGKIAGGTETKIARTGIGMAVRKGAAKPDISTTEAFKRALLQAQSIMHNKEGISGTYMAALFQRLGLADQLKDKIRLKLVSGPVAENIAQGDAEIGFQLVSEILPVKGAELVGPLPAELQTYVVLTAGIGASAKEAEAGRELIRFLKQPTSAEVMKAGGLEPLP